MYATKSVLGLFPYRATKIFELYEIKSSSGFVSFKFLQIRVSSANFHGIMGKVCYLLDIYVGNCYVISIQ